VFHIASDIGHGKTVMASISGLAIINADNGPGIYNDGGTVTLNNCVISGNTNACDTCPGFGGGIYNDGHQFKNHPSASAALHISNCTITGNFAGQGAGINNDGITGSATFDINNSAISG